MKRARTWSQKKRYPDLGFFGNLAFSAAFASLAARASAFLARLASRSASFSAFFARLASLSAISSAVSCFTGFVLEPGVLATAGAGSLGALTGMFTCSTWPATTPGGTVSETRRPSFAVKYSFMPAVALSGTVRQTFSRFGGGGGGCSMPPTAAGGDCATAAAAAAAAAAFAAALAAAVAAAIDDASSEEGMGCGGGTGFISCIGIGIGTGGSGVGIGICWGATG